MVDAVAQALRELFGPLGGVETFGGEPEARIYRVGGHTFQVESCPEGDVLHVHEGLERLRTRRRAQEISLIAAPFMGEVPRDLCEREGAGWLDLCGNARVVAPGLYIHVDGRPNRFRRPGRPANLFAPRRANIARILLANPSQYFAQRLLAIWTSTSGARSRNRRAAPQELPELPGCACGHRAAMPAAPARTDGEGAQSLGGWCLTKLPPI